MFVHCRPQMNRRSN